MSLFKEGEKMDTMGFMNFIEDLRYSRGMSQEDFLHDVISVRQYQRYRNGESEVSMDCIERMSIKLGIETRKLLADFQHEKFREKEKVEEFYNSVVYKKQDDVIKFEKYFDTHKFLDKTNEEIYTLAIILKEYLLHNLNKEQFLTKVYNLINYPKILDYDILRDVEIIGLLVIYQHNKNIRSDIIKLVKSIDENRNLLVSGQSYFVLIIFAYFIAIDYNNKEMYEEAEEYCFKAINLLRKKHSDYSLYLIYYQLAKSYFCRGMTYQFKETLYKCIIQTRAINSTKLTGQINEMIKEHFNINADSFLMEYIKMEKKT